MDQAGTEILPEQYIARRQGAHQPLRRLMIAILEEAIRTFQRYLFTQSKAGQRLFREAETWLMDESQDVPLRFTDVCDVLELDAGFLRHALRRWRERALVTGTATPARRERSVEPGRVIRLEAARHQRPLAGATDAAPAAPRRVGGPRTAKRGWRVRLGGAKAERHRAR